jgi:uncharacterized protein (DUF433 family)
VKTASGQICLGEPICQAATPNRLCTNFARTIASFAFSRAIPASRGSAAYRHKYLEQAEGRRYNRAMIDWSTCSAVERDPEKVGGSWVFRGTRVPVVALFENLEGGASVEDFLSWFPGVTREHVEAVLECTIKSLRPGRQAA